MAAGPWYSGAGLGDANQALTTKTISLALDASIKNGEIIGHPVMQAILARDQGLGQLMGALGVSMSLADIGQGKAAATAEGTQAAATNFDEASVTVTPARREFVRKVSDYGTSLQNGLLQGVLAPNDMALLTYEGFRIWANTLVNLVVALASSASNDIGTTGTALTWADVQNGAYSLKNGGNQGSVLMLVTEKGATDLANDALSLGGAVSMSQQVQQFLNAGVTGARIGSFFGGIDIYLNSELDTDGGDTLGIAFSDEGINTKHQRVSLPANADTLVDAGFYTMELLRPGGGINDVSTAMYNGVGIRQDTPALRAVRYSTT